MKKPNSQPLKTIIYFLIISLVYGSCQVDNESLSPQEANFVDVCAAQDLVDKMNLTTQFEENGARTSKSNFKSVETIVSVPDETGKTLFYVVNYIDGGFVILSADNRTQPILAHSNESTFPMNLDGYPDGLVGWLIEEKEHIKEIRKSNKKQAKEIAKLWRKEFIEEFLNSGLDGIANPPPNPPPSPDNPEECYITAVYGPLLTTKWDQGCGYNDLMGTCPFGGGSCGRAWTGCVATAMAQVMRFHQLPASYNWASMPNTYGSPETARLMRDIGNAVNMDYGCDGSSADTKDEVASSFRFNFGYSSASYADYSSSDPVKTNIRNNRPVIFRGGSKAHWLIFPYYTGGHAWVCDGYKSYYTCETSVTYLYYNMNWGWGGYLNGWYAHADWSPGDSDFNYKRGVVYNIIP